MNGMYISPGPTRSEIDTSRSAVLLEFGTPWCGHCRAAQPLITGAVSAHPELQHLKVEDGSGRPLGRSFGVRLWPTLVFLRDGLEVARLVRPANHEAIADALTQIAAAG